MKFSLKTGFMTYVSDLWHGFHWHPSEHEVCHENKRSECRKVNKLCHLKLGTVSNCDELYDKVFLHTVCSLKCHYKIVMNKKAVTMLQVRCLLWVSTFHNHGKWTGIPVFTQKLPPWRAKHFRRAQHSYMKLRLEYISTIIYGDCLISFCSDNFIKHNILFQIF
jgi:hypothetical protein